MGCLKNKIFKFLGLCIVICFACVGLCEVYSINEQQQEQQQVDRFRRHLVNSFEHIHDGRKINFNDAKVDYYSKMLEEKMREFLNKRQSLTWQQFYDSCFDYLKSNQNHQVKVLNRSEFENFCKLNSDEECRLFVGVKSDIFAGEFKKGLIFSDKAKKYFLADESAQIKQPFSQYIYSMADGPSCSSYSGLAAFECLKDAISESREFAEGQLMFPGFVGELVVRNLNVVDADFLSEVLAVLKYNNPQEFGFASEIDHHFNEHDESKKLIKIESEEYKNKDNAKQKAQDYVDSVYYDKVLYYVFANENQTRNELFKQKTGEAVEYADVVLKFNDEQFKQYSDRFAMLFPDWFSKQVELGFELNFMRNKTIALMENYGVLAKLLGFDAVKLNVGDNPGYILVNAEKVDAVCAELKPSGCDEFEVWRVPVGCWG